MSDTIRRLAAGSSFAALQDKINCLRENYAVSVDVVFFLIGSIIWICGTKSPFFQMTPIKWKYKQVECSTAKHSCPDCSALIILQLNFICDDLLFCLARFVTLCPVSFPNKV